MQAESLEHLQKCVYTYLQKYATISSFH